ncbi:type II secretion system F family protein [Candidatus Gottesmanbacteria bacterium]|nr:type II secretion system F family protein [Candidatus Gottesmanbacteria bacterium]
MKLSFNPEIFSHVSHIDKLFFTRHLAIMIKSGIPIAEALTIIHDQNKSSSFKIALWQIYKNVENGQTLSKSLGNHPKIFDKFYLSLIDVGEKSGTLENNLEYLAAYLDKQYRLNQKIQGAMFYPTFVLVATSVIGGAISFFVLPKMIDLFSSFNVELPLSTKILLAMANIIKNYGIVLLFIFGILIVSFKAIIKTPFIKPLWHRILLKIPIFGNIIQNTELVNFTRNIGTMLKSGLPIILALDIQQGAASNVIFRGYLTNLAKAVAKGKSIMAELETGKYNHIPPIVAKMIGVGEKTGRLEENLLYLGDFFEEEIDNTTKNLSTILEPVLLVFIAVIVGFVALSIISPIYQFTSSIE